MFLNDFRFLHLITKLLGSLKEIVHFEVKIMSTGNVLDSGNISLIETDNMLFSMDKPQYYEKSYDWVKFKGYLNTGYPYGENVEY